MKRPAAALAPVYLLLALFACTGKSTKSDDRDGADATAQGTPRKVALGMAETGAALTDFGFATATVQLVCDGFAADAPGNAPQELKLGDALTLFGEPTGCTLRLRALASPAATFRPKDGHDFTTYAVGDSAIFSDGTTELLFRVEEQLPSPLQTDATVKYSYAQLLRDPDVPLESVDINITENVLEVTGEPAPNVRLTRALLVKLDPLHAGIKLIFACEGDCPADLATLWLHTGPAPTEELTLASATALFEQSHQDLGGLEVVLPLTAFGCAKLQELAGKSLIAALKRPAGKSIRHAIIKVGQLPDLLHRSCKYRQGVTIPHGTVYEDPSRPRFEAPLAKLCKVVAYEAWTCTDGTLFGPGNVTGNYSSCRTCDEASAQNDNTQNDPACN